MAKLGLLPDKATLPEINAYFDKQYLRYGGFCGECGEGVKPMLNDDVDTFGLCEFNGSHPDCGDHNMKFVEKTPETFGGYEIYKCKNCEHQEAL